MRIYTDTASHYIKSLALCLLKDPASLEAWRCLICQSPPDSSGQLPSLEHSNLLLHKLQEHYSIYDCDIVLCGNNAILVISKTMDNDSLQELAGIIQLSQSHPLEIDIYDMFYEWRSVWEVLYRESQEIISLPQEIRIPYGQTSPFGDTSSFTEIFQLSASGRRLRESVHILVVEDDAFTRKAIVKLFKDNHTIIAAHNASEAVSNYLLHAPDIVFLDINLPDANGFDVLHEIIRHDKEAYVVMFSGHSYLDNITYALLQGANGFIAKPFRKEKIFHYVKTCAALRLHRA